MAMPADSFDGFHFRVVHAPELGSAQREQLLALLQGTFSAWAERGIDHLEWKIAGPTSLPTRVALIELEGRIVGLSLGLHRAYRVRGETRDARDAVDAMVHPDFRDRGIYQARRRFTRAYSDHEFDLSVGFSGNPAIHHIREKLGQGILLGNPLRVWVRPFDARALAKEEVERYGGRVPVPLAALALGAGSALARLLPTRAPRAAARVTIQPVAHFGPEFDELFEDAVREFDFVPVRDSAVLEWRYADPRAGRFVCRAAEEEGRLQGYCVVAVAGARGYLVDLLVRPGRLDVARSLVDDALSQLREAGASAAVCWMAQRHPYTGLLRAAGFLRSRRPVGFATRTMRLAKGELDFLRDPASRVHLTYGDSDWI